MKILVPTKRVPSPDAVIRIRPDGSGIDESSLSFAMNPFDAIALEAALLIRERGRSPVEVMAVSIGGGDCENELRTALAMGADRALRVECDDPLDPWCVAQLLAAVVRRERPDLILMGKQAVDDDSNQTGQMLAGLLDWPQATFASRIDFESETRLIVARETDLGIERVAVVLPAVVTTDLRLNQPRYASLPAMLKAKRRPIETIPWTELGVEIRPRVRVLRLDSASVERACERVKDVAELVDRLRYEAKVI